MIQETVIRLNPFTVLAAIVAIILSAACRTAPNPAVGGDYFTDIASINDIQMYYEVHGDGPPLILLHGGLGNASHWKNQIPVLAGHYKVIAPDGRGQGSSSLTDRKISYELMAADVLALMDHLEIDRAHVIGGGPRKRSGQRRRSVFDGRRSDSCR